MALLLITFGLVAFERIPLREYPDIDAPVVSIETNYRGASASVVETRITQLIEDRIAGLEGINFIQSSSQDGRSRVTIEFNTNRNIDDAANDIRDRIAAILDDLPIDADAPEISKVDGNDDVILWLNLVNDNMSVPELTDYARRYLVDRFSVLDGVARVRIGGAQDFAMRVWLDRQAMAARNITVADIERALRAENVELPAGSLESLTRQFSLRTERAFRNADDFAALVLARGEDNYLVRLGDVARVEKTALEERTAFRGNGETMIGLGIIKQSTANTLAVARLARAQAQTLNASLPEGMSIKESFDSSVFIDRAIYEVYVTIGVAIALVIFVIYAFLGSVRTTLIPAVTVPVSIIATFIVLYTLGFSANLLTLLALVLAIGLVVDDAIVVLENIHRRMDEYKETPLVAAYYGTRQVGFAVIATTLVLIAVFIPISFLEGSLGRLFREFAFTMAAAVAFSSFVALSLSAMLASQVLRSQETRNRFSRNTDAAMHSIRRRYERALRWAFSHKHLVMLGFFICSGSIAWLYQHLPQEYAPREDRGAFFVLVNAPEGSSYAYTEAYMNEIELRLMPYVEKNEITRLLVRTPRGFGNLSAFDNGIVIAVLNDWSQRRPANEIMANIRRDLADLSGVRAFPVMRQGLGGGIQKPVQFVVGGSSYEQLAEWRDILVEKINANNIGLEGLDWDYKETQPQMRINIDYTRAADLGIRLDTIGNTLQTMLGSRRVTTYNDDGQEYDVVLEGERAQQRTPTNLSNIYVRSERTQQLIPLSNFASLEEMADANSLNRFNRVRAITFDANLADGVSLEQALTFLEDLVAEHLPEEAVIDYKGPSREFKNSGQSILFVFALGLLVVFLVLAAQFESYVHPLVIMLTVPLAIAGGLLGLWLTGQSLNIYSQIGLIMLVGLAAKNGILIVEFANQLRDGGARFHEAIVDAALTRLRPVLMTAITTAVGAVPLIIASGAGAETRYVIGVVVLSGVVIATFFTLFVVPIAYALIAHGTGSPNRTVKRLGVEKRLTPS